MLAPSRPLWDVLFPASKKGPDVQAPSCPAPPMCRDRGGAEAAAASLLLTEPLWSLPLLPAFRSASLPSHRTSKSLGTLSPYSQVIKRFGTPLLRLRLSVPTKHPPHAPQPRGAPPARAESGRLRGMTWRKWQWLRGRDGWAGTGCAFPPRGGLSDAPGSLAGMWGLDALSTRGPE